MSQGGNNPKKYRVHVFWCILIFFKGNNISYDDAHEELCAHSMTGRDSYSFLPLSIFTNSLLTHHNHQDIMRFTKANILVFLVGILAKEVASKEKKPTGSPTRALIRQINPARSKAPRVGNWASVLDDTYWMVYPEGLPAYELQGNSLGTFGQGTATPPVISALQDMTVYHIQNTTSGGSGGRYWFGTIAVFLMDPYYVYPPGFPQAQCGTVLSPILDDGSLILSATTSQFPNLQQNWGTGRMVWMNVNGIDQWTMQNWKVEGYVHLAFMIQTKPGHKYWLDLPLVNKSVPEFLAPCTDFTPVDPKPNPPMP